MFPFSFSTGLEPAWDIGTIVSLCYILHVVSIMYSLLTKKNNMILTWLLFNFHNDKLLVVIGFFTFPVVLIGDLISETKHGQETKVLVIIGLYEIMNTSA